MEGREYSSEELVHLALVDGMTRRIKEYGQAETLRKINKLSMSKSVVMRYKKLFFEAVRLLEVLPKED